jgi:hypothetical protein
MMTRKPKVTVEDRSAKGTPEQESKDTQDGCDIEFGDAEQTPDEDLPASTGGVA